MPKTNYRGQTSHKMDNRAKTIMQGHPSMTPMKVVKQAPHNKKKYA